MVNGWLSYCTQRMFFSGKAKADCFRVFEPQSAEQIGAVYLRNFKEIYDVLAYENLCRLAKPVPPEWIPVEIRIAPSVELMRGLRLGYTSTRMLRFSVQPTIEVEPVAFVRIPPLGTWIVVESDAEGEHLPHEKTGSTSLEAHIDRIEGHSQRARWTC